VEAQELVRQALAEDQHVVGIHRHPNAGVEEDANGVRGQVIDPAQHHVRGRADVQPDAVVGQEAHDLGRGGGGDPMLNLVQFQQLDRAPHVVSGSPFSHMRLESKTGGLGVLVDGGEDLDRLGEFVPRQIDGLAVTHIQERLHPALDRGDRTVARDAKLGDPVDIRRVPLMGGLETGDEPRRGSLVQGDRPDVLADLKPGDAVAPGLDQRRLESDQPPLPIREQTAGGLVEPGLHVGHGGKFALKRRDPAAGAFKDIVARAAADEMVVEIGLGIGADCGDVAKLKRSLKVHHAVLQRRPGAVLQRFHWTFDHAGPNLWEQNSKQVDYDAQDRCIDDRGHRRAGAGRLPSRRAHP
jgi:hypothetical protein